MRILPISRPQRRGYSLVEVMVSVGIAGIVIVGTLRSLTYQFGIQDRNRERLYVSHVLQSRLEEVRDLSFENLSNYEPQATFDVSPASMINGMSVNPDIVVDESDFDAALREATGTIYVQEIATGLKRVTIDITWETALSSRPVTMSTTTYISQTGAVRQ